MAKRKTVENASNAVGSEEEYDDELLRQPIPEEVGTWWNALLMDAGLVRGHVLEKLSTKQLWLFAAELAVDEGMSDDFKRRLLAAPTHQVMPLLIEAFLHAVNKRFVRPASLEICADDTPTYVSPKVFLFGHGDNLTP